MKNTALLIIDIQNGLFEKQRKIFNESKLLNNINVLIKYQKDKILPVIFIQHNNKQLQKGTKNWEIHDALIKSKDDIVIQKTEGDAFSNTELDDILKAKDNVKSDKFTIALTSEKWARPQLEELKGLLQEAEEAGVVDAGLTNKFVRLFLRAIGRKQFYVSYNNSG